MVVWAADSVCCVEMPGPIYARIPDLYTSREELHATHLWTSDEICKATAGFTAINLVICDAMAIVLAPVISNETHGLCIATGTGCGDLVACAINGKLASAVESCEVAASSCDTINGCLADHKDSMSCSLRVLDVNIGAHAVVHGFKASVSIGEAGDGPTS